jgi:flagellar FliL protein
LYSIKNAIANNDAEALVKKIDFKQLRESIKANMNANIALNSMNDSTSSEPFGLFGDNLASSMIDAMVDRYVTEEMLTMSMRNENISEDKDSLNIFTIRKQLKETGISMGYSGLNRFIVNVDMGQGDAVKLIMGREGMFSWKIVKVDFGGFMASLLKGVEQENQKTAKIEKYPLQPFIVSIGDKEGFRYVKITISLDLTNKDTMEEIEKRITSIRDGILTILSQKTYEQIGTEQEKDLLKQEVLRRINSLLPENGVDAVYFDEFKSQ